MFKSVLLAAVLAVAFIVPASAQDMKCDEETLTKMKVNVDAMTDKEKQTTTMKEWEMAMEAMKANKMDECMMHMTNVDKGGGGQGN